MSLPETAILMGSFNGAAFLAEQLDSLAAQSHTRWRLWVSDDGSTDGALKILADYQARWGREKLSFGPGPGLGFARNFLSLAARPEIEADYYAWCDQDDIWLPRKLERALAALAPYGQDTPALYGGRTILADREGRAYGLSPLLNRRPPSFANALTQCIFGGNTMVFNNPARRLIAGVSVAYSHDWLTYQAVSGAGGRVIYDPEPWLRYRQHGASSLGGNRGWRARLTRLRMLLDGRFKRAVDLQLAALSRLAAGLSVSSRRLLEELLDLRRSPSPFKRLARFRRGGFYRQDRVEQGIFYLAAAFNRL